MKNILNALPLLVAFLLIAYGSNQSAFQSPSPTASPVPEGELWQVKPGFVYDGDTLRVVRGKQELKLRLACIDAPEVKQDEGIGSRDYLRALLDRAGNRVKIELADTDRYDRAVAEIYTPAGELVQLQQVQAGWVWANEQYQSDCSHWKEIEKAAREAKAERRGIWAGNPSAPWEWRKQHRS